MKHAAAVEVCSADSKVLLRNTCNTLDVAQEVAEREARNLALGLRMRYEPIEGVGWLVVDAAGTVRYRVLVTESGHLDTTRG